MESGKGMLSHMKCLEYEPLKLKWEKALLKGEQRRCPGCKITGVKDDHCTHMKCSNCDTIWCYFCGKPENQLDKSDSNGGIFRHNDDWENNSKRCPTYLNDIASIDERWKFGNDSDAKEFFHKLLTLKQIRRFIHNHSKKEFNKLCDRFKSVANHGYDLNEALA